MLKQIMALMLCAFLSLATEPAKPETPKPLEGQTKVEVLEALVAAQAAEADSERLVSEMKERILTSDAYQLAETSKREARKKYEAALARARVASGAPPECQLTARLEWVKAMGNQTVPCTIPPKAPAKPEVKK